MALNPAQTLAQIAKTYRDTKGVEEENNIKTLMATLQTKMVNAANVGAIYVSLSADTDTALYNAVSTKSGIKFLKEKGFTLDIMNRVTVIYWDAKNAIELELNPPAIVENPTVP